MVRTAAILLAVTAVIFIVVFTRQRPTAVGQAHVSPAPETNADARPEPTNGAYRGRKIARLRDVLTDANDPEFVERVVPGLRKFFGTLDQAGVNPLKGEPLAFDKITISYPPNGMDCQFIINDAWTALYKEDANFSGIIYFGQRGPNNPFRANRPRRH
jgi:hypothetical protein